MNTLTYISTALTRTSSNQGPLSPALDAPDSDSLPPSPATDDALAGLTTEDETDTEVTESGSSASERGRRGYLTPLPPGATTSSPPEPELDPTSPPDPPIHSKTTPPPSLTLDSSHRLPAPGPDTVYLSASSLAGGAPTFALSTNEPERIRVARARQAEEEEREREREQKQEEDEKAAVKHEGGVDTGASVEGEFAEGEHRLLARRAAGRWTVTNWSVRLGVSFYVILRAIFGYVGFKPFGKLNLQDKPAITAAATATADPTNSSADSLTPGPFPPPTPSPPPTAKAPSGPIRKPPHLTPKTLVLDLDETLIHSTSRPYAATRRTRQLKARAVEVVLDGRSTVYTVYKRPWVDFFLRKVSAWYTVVIFTASLPEYADPVIDWLDGGDGAGGMVGGRLFRSDCVYANGSYLKDLSVVDPDLARVCLVDNSPTSYSINQANGIPIEGWINDPNDECLLDLLPMLDSLRFTNDVRRVLGLRGFGRT